MNTGTSVYLPTVFGRAYTIGAIDCATLLSSPTGATDTAIDGIVTAPIPFADSIASTAASIRCGPAASRPTLTRYSDGLSPRTRYRCCEYRPSPDTRNTADSLPSISQSHRSHAAVITATPSPGTALAKSVDATGGCRPRAGRGVDTTGGCGASARRRMTTGNIRSRVYPMGRRYRPCDGMNAIGRAAVKA